MPNPLKKAKLSRFISSLRSKRGDSLVVQTGFPTSLADLIVKNQSRLRKPSLRKKPSSSESSSFRVSQIVIAAAAAVRSPSDDVDAGAESETNREVQLSPVEENTRCDDAVEGIQLPLAIAEETGSPPESDDRAEAQTLEFSMKGEDFESGRRRGITMLAVLLLVMILAVGAKKLVVGITASAFTLLFLESVGMNVPIFFRPWIDEKRNLKSLIQDAFVLIQTDELGSNATGESPVMEDRAHRFDFSSVGLNENSQIEVSDQSGDCSKEREDQDECITSARKLIVSNGKSKGNKLLRKFVLKKYRGTKFGREADGRESVLPNKKEERIEAAGEDVEVEDADDDINDDIEERVSNSKTFNEVLGSDVVVGVGFMRSNTEGLTKKERNGHLVFFAVILIGLVGGRVTALVLTLMWCFLMKFREN